ncbi:MAG TPA: PEP-CTERM sorting domain-containing protein [Rhodocyclaceae bacterium]|nr:PEP-CTERM sorting domain-containing protein [Rhodocyclaceae bacterium]HNH34907.1 PEP-CTERM sorting domain-containing protein [Rhodocyclaceae bacterium]
MLVSRSKDIAVAALALGLTQAASAALVTDPNDSRNWQGATVGTFAQLYFGADTLANRQQIVDRNLLDDGVFNPAGYSAAPLISCVGCTTGDAANAAGRSDDLTGTGSFGYTYPSDQDRTFAGSHIDNYWLQTGTVIGGAVWDLGPGASTAIIFNTIDHGPLPLEAIESTVYLSNDRVTWTQAVTQRVWLEGFMSNTGIQWDGFTYAVGTGTSDTFRYASIVWGGPGALQADGDNEINGVMGATVTFTPTVPEPETYAMMLAGLGLVGAIGRKRRQA